MVEGLQYLKEVKQEQFDDTLVETSNEAPEASQASPQNDPTEQQLLKELQDLCTFIQYHGISSHSLSESLDPSLIVASYLNSWL